ncbi:hypothetical protein ACS0TY_020788 [Phlomoides rotata]
MLKNCFKKKTKEKRRNYIKEEEEVMDNLHISIVYGYFSNLSTTCHFPEHPYIIAYAAEHPSFVLRNPKTAFVFKRQLMDMFEVPRLNSIHQTQNRINKFHLLQAFLTLLLQLIYHKTDRIVARFQDGVDKLEKELRFLLTILGDISWMMLDTDPDFQNLLPDFEGVANQAGSFVHSLFFSYDPAFKKEKNERLAAVLNRTDLLKANLESYIMSKPAYTSPTTSIVDSILILDSLVDDLKDLLERGDDRIADVKDQVNLLHHELLLSHSSINDMRSPQPSEVEELKDPLMRIGGIAHQAEYLITSFLVKDAPLWYVFNRLTDLNHRIQPVRTELQLITLKYSSFGGLKVVEEPIQDKRNTEVNVVTVGFEDITIKTLDQLVGGSESLQIISILGMPGLGKTTLAKKLYNHPLVNYTFDKLSWCVVSQTYKRHDILANILIHINTELGNDKILEMEEMILVEHIYKTMKGRRYLIVLDDIWESNVLDGLLRCFPDDGNGSRILFTSRNKNVAPPNCVICELPFLTDEQCWELLEKKAFGCGICPAGLQGIGKKIAARCCGLPLTVVVIAGVLLTMDEEESKWEEVGVNLASYTDNSVRQILELSYKHLPDHLKPCFLYFGGFKEDEEISVGNLKRLWVAEGFIRKEKDKSAENIAGEYLMELIDKSLVMIGKRRIDGRGAKSCVVHDLLHDLCMKKNKEESFLKYLNNDYSTIFEKGHRMQGNGDSAISSYCQHVRSFVADKQSSSFNVRNMRLLRVLYFKGYRSNCKTFGIEYLVNLRYLIIGNLPTWMDSLVNLEYLRLGYSFRYLLPSIVKMKKLRYLCAYSIDYGEDWNKYQTNNLEYLSNFRIRKVKDEELLKCSPHLRKLKCTYVTKGIMDKSAYPHFDLCFLTLLDSLSLFGFLGKRDFGFPSNIRKLELYGSGFPWEKMSIVGRLEFLEVLKLREEAFVGKRWYTRDDEFQKLRFLKLENIEFSEWNVTSSEHFPVLQQLILIKCKNLREIPGEIGEITTLELIEVNQPCLSSVVESAERIKEQQREMENEELRVVIHDSTYMLS